jgi:hypothetical protein
MRWRAAWLYDAGRSRPAANACMDIFGGFAFAVEYT